MSFVNCAPELNVSAFISSERTNRWMARQTDMSSSTMAIRDLRLSMNRRYPKPITNDFDIQDGSLCGESIGGITNCILDLSPTAGLARSLTWRR